MAASSGGDVRHAAEVQDENLSMHFTSPPSSVIYSPALNCLIGTTKENAIEVLDIHTGLVLRHVEVPGTDCDPHELLVSAYLDDEEKFIVGQGRRVGCRGILGEKILLDSILQTDVASSGAGTVKIELDIVQAGILLNGLLLCQQQTASSNIQHGPQPFKFEDDLNTLVSNLQKQYESTLQKIKDTANKAVKWLTVSLDMEPTFLSDVFVRIYGIMTLKNQDPSLPVIGDIVRRLSLCCPPKWIPEIGKIDRITMVGEAERLETFDTWPHLDYKYALPGPMAEAGFYHPESSKTSEDRAMCFSCNVCLVCWEPSDQPWSEHERHSSSCPFVKGEYTANVPLSICVGTTHAQYLERQSAKIVCFGLQSVGGLFATGHKDGSVAIWDTYPLLKLHSEIRLGTQTVKLPSDKNKNNSTVSNIPAGANITSNPLQYIVSESMNLIGSELQNVFPGFDPSMLDDSSTIQLAEMSNGYPAELPQNFDPMKPLIAVSGLPFLQNKQEHDVIEDKVEESALKNNDEAENAGNNELNRSLSETDGQQDKNPCRTCLQMYCLTLTQVKQKGETDQKKSMFVVAGVRKTSQTDNEKSSDSKLCLFIHKVQERTNCDKKSGVQKNTKSKSSQLDPSFLTMAEDMIFDSEEEFYGESDETSELSVIDEYLMANKPLSSTGSAKKGGSNVENKANDKENQQNEGKLQEVELPNSVDHQRSRISHVLATEKNIIVIVKCVVDKKDLEPSGTEIAENDSANTEAVQPEIDFSGGETLEHVKPLDEHKITDINETSTNSSEQTTLVLVYEWSKGSNTTCLSQCPNLQKPFAPSDMIHDGFITSFDKLRIGEHYYRDKDFSSSFKRQDAPLLVLSVGKSLKSFLVIDTNDFELLCKIPIPSQARSKAIIKTVHCAGIGVIAVCLEDGTVVLCDLEGENKQKDTERTEEPTQEAAQALDGPLDHQKLEQLTDLTRFSPISQGVHVFVPVDWMVGKAVLSVNAPLQKRRLQPHVQEIYPVSGPARLQGKNGGAHSSTKTERLKSDDKSVTFKVFVGSETAIGYMDISVECTSQITDTNDIVVLLYAVDHSQSYRRDEGEDEPGQLICGPALLSEFKLFKGSKASLTLSSKKLISIKSSYFLLKLERTSVTGTIQPSGSKDSQNEPSASTTIKEKGVDVPGVGIADFVYSIRMVVHQFNSLSSYSPSLPSSCRTFMLESVEFQEKLVEYLLMSTENDKQVHEGSDARMSIELITWIWQICNSSFSSLTPIVSIVEKYLPAFLKAFFLNGDRSFAHRGFQLLSSIVRYSSKLDEESFMNKILSGLQEVIPQIAFARSIAAVRWFFRACALVVTRCSSLDLVRKLLSLLIDVSKAYGASMMDDHKILQARFDLPATPFDPIIAEPLRIDLPLGDMISAQSQDEFDQGLPLLNSNADGKFMSIPASDAPGLLEVHPLAFICLITSEGSHVEKLSSAIVKTQGLKTVPIGLHPSFLSQAAPVFSQDGTSTPLSMNDNFPAYYPKTVDDDFYSSYEIPPPNAALDVLDEQVNQLLELGSMEPWQGIKMNKAKIIKKRHSSFKPDAVVEVESEFIIPDPVALVVDRMHAAAQHFAVLDFRRPINLTDIIIPPCSSLASVSIFVWQGGQTENEALHVATSDEISYRALLLTDMMPSIRCRYVKVIAAGTRKLNSSKVTISLGQFYGRPADGIYEKAALAERLYTQYDSIFCHYSLAVDRLYTAFKDIRNDNDIAEIEKSRTMKAYKECCGTQLYLNFIRNAIAFYDLSTTTLDAASPNEISVSGTVREGVKLSPDFGSLSHDHLRVIMECIIETLLTALSNGQTIEELKQYENTDEGVPLNIDECLELFKNVNICGSPRLRQEGSLLIQCLCEAKPWWGEFLVSSFRLCFEEEGIIPVPRERLFHSFMRILRTASNLNTVLLSFLYLLQDLLSSLSSKEEKKSIKLNFDLIDWIMLVLNELLQHLDDENWLFLTPWSTLVREASTLESRTHEHLRSYLQEQQKKLSNLSEKVKAIASTIQQSAKKKYGGSSQVKVKVKGPNKQLKDLLLLRTHPIFAKKGQGGPSDGQLSAEASKLMKESTPTILVDKKQILPALRSLVTLLLATEVEVHLDRFLLTSKVAALLSKVCSTTICLPEIITIEDLKRLLTLPTVTTGDQKSWVGHCVVCLLKNLVSTKTDKDVVCDANEAETTLTTETSSETPKSDSQTPAEPSDGDSGDSSATTSGHEGEYPEENVADIASSLASNLMNVIEEKSTGKRKTTAQINTTNAASIEKTPYASIYPWTYATSPVLEGFFKVYEVYCKKDILNISKIIGHLMQKGFDRCVEQNNESPLLEGQSPGMDQERLIMVSSMLSETFSDLFIKFSSQSSIPPELLIQWLALSEIHNCDIRLGLTAEALEALTKLSQPPLSNNFVGNLLSKALTTLTASSSESSKELAGNQLLTSYVLKALSDASIRSQSSPLMNIQKTLLQHLLSANRSPSTDNNGSLRITLKQFLLRILQDFRNQSISDATLPGIVEPVFNSPILDCFQHEEIDITVKLFDCIADLLSDFIKTNKELLKASLEDFSSRQLVFVVHEGQMMRIGKSYKNGETGSWAKLVEFLDKLLRSKLVHPKRIPDSDEQQQSNPCFMESICESNSNSFEYLIIALNCCGDPKLKLNKQHILPEIFYTMETLQASPLVLHPVVEKIYNLLSWVGENENGKVCLLRAILNFFRNEKGSDTDLGTLMVMSKAVRRLLLNLLKCEQDVKIFVEEGGSEIACDYISRQSLRCTSSQMQSDSAVSRALTLKGRKDNSPGSNKMRRDASGSETQNFAPCGKIFGPANSTPAEIILQNKSPQRRSRFAAWSYNFSEPEEQWISLTVELPFVILLKEVIVTMHHSFLGSCPSEVVIEVKSTGEKFLPHTPALQSSGLSCVTVHFAKGVPAKAIKLNIKRPWDSDSVKLNLIEIYGKPALSLQRPTSAKRLSKRFHWIEVLYHASVTWNGFAEYLGKDSQRTKTLMEALIDCFNMASGEKTTRQKYLLSLLVNIGANIEGLWEELLNSLLPITANDGPHSILPVTSTRMACSLVSQLFVALQEPNKTKYLTHLLQWSEKWMNIIIDVASVDAFSWLGECLLTTAHIIHLFVKTEQEIDQELVSRLSSVSLKAGKLLQSKTVLFQGIASLLCSLSRIDKELVKELTQACRSNFPENPTLLYNRNEDNVIQFTAFVSRPSENLNFMMHSGLPHIICTAITHSLGASLTVPILNVLYELKILLNYFIIASDNVEFKKWIGSEENKALWKTLIVRLSSSVAGKVDDNGLYVKEIHGLQSATVLLFRKLFRHSHYSQQLLVDVLKEILFERSVNHGLLASNCFLKRLILQLILDEEDIQVLLEPYDRDTLSSERDSHYFPELTQLRNRLDNRVVKRMRLSQPLSAICPFVPKEEKTETPVDPRVTAVSEGLSTFSSPYTTSYTQTWPSLGVSQHPVGMNDPGDVALMMSSAKSVTTKRQTKPSGSDPNSDDASKAQYSVTYYHQGIDGGLSALPSKMMVGEVIEILRGRGIDCSSGMITLKCNVQYCSKEDSKEQKGEIEYKSILYSSLLHVFSANGGLELLARWKGEHMNGELGDSLSNSIAMILKLVPLPGFANMLLEERRKAEFLLRLMLGVEENSEGDPISASKLAPTLPLLPFIALQKLLKSASLNITEGRRLRENAFERGIFQLVLNRLAALCHQEKPPTESERKAKKSSQKANAGPSYWAKGTGFGTGSTVSTWDVEKAMQEKKREEEYIGCLFQVLSSFMAPTIESVSSENLQHLKEPSLPSGLSAVLEQSCLVDVLSSYLRNDSVLDMARHIPLYHAIMELLRSLACHLLLMPWLTRKTASGGGSSVPSTSLGDLLHRLKICADTYVNRLKGSKKRKPAESLVRGPKYVALPKKEHKEKKHSKSAVHASMADIPNESITGTEGLNALIGDIRETSNYVETIVEFYLEQKRIEEANNDLKSGGTLQKEDKENAAKKPVSLEEQYIDEMRDLQFDTHELVTENDDGKLVFNCPYHYASTIRSTMSSGDFGSPARARRLAQEIASLSTSLPLSFSSSVFVRSDESRLDVMKVLITGPEDTPYANGCYEFDIYFPLDYPNSPMMVNLQTTGQHSVRFNPNLYNDGKVCLSILNTWHGKPEEKWNPSTSNLLQVLVSIQSLILVPDPYFNEPGYERSRGTPVGKQNSMDYNANIRQASVKWAMLEQIRKPAACFKKIIERHFIMKKDGIIKQCEKWLEEMKEQSSKKKSSVVHYESLKRHFGTLKIELEKLCKGESPSSTAEADKKPEATKDEEENQIVFV